MPRNRGDGALNAVFSHLSTHRRYEVWFVRLGLADGSGAWWFRYLLMNPGKGGCAANPRGDPVQVWATYFKKDAQPQSFIQGFPLDPLDLSSRNCSPFHFSITENTVDENSCRGHVTTDGHDICWNLSYASTFATTLSDKGWIGFSRTPHSDAVFSGEITLDGHKVEGHPLGFGLQGHNCGYRHRSFWTWAHAYFPRASGNPSTFEALCYDMPFGLMFRKAVLWHGSKRYVFRNFLYSGVDRNNFSWKLRFAGKDGSQLDAVIDGSNAAIHRLPYLKTDCSGNFEVTNNSIASATMRFALPGRPAEELHTAGGAVLEMAGGE